MSKLPKNRARLSVSRVLSPRTFLTAIYNDVSCEEKGAGVLIIYLGLPLLAGSSGFYDGSLAGRFEV